MTPLRQQRIDAMLVRGFSPRTHKSYLAAVTDLARHYQRSPDRVSLEEVQAYILCLVKERHLADASCRLYLNGLRFLYLQVLGWQDFDVPIPHPKRVQRIPELLTRKDVARLIGSCPNLKHRTMLLTCYGCGLRVSELVHIKVRDLDGESRLLRVEQGKGAKDRKVIIAPTLLQHLGDYRQTHALDARRLAVCRHVKQCRTAALGGLQLHCDHCGDAPVHYFSCRDRHCPQCQHRASGQWSEKQQDNLLSATYFHLVFTLPEVINGWARLHPEVIYRLLFRVVWETLKAFGADSKRLGGELGMTAFLHTWGQTLGQHLHLHCLVPGGALTEKGDWTPVKGSYLFPVRAVSRRFRGHMVSQLRQAHTAGELPRIIDPGEPGRTLDRLMQQDWAVYSRPGLSKPEQLLDYLARYTHRTAISNARLLSMDEAQVRFRYKDYRDHDELSSNLVYGAVAGAL